MLTCYADLRWKAVEDRGEKREFLFRRRMTCCLICGNAHKGPEASCFRAFGIRCQRYEQVVRRERLRGDHFWPLTSSGVL